MVVPIAADPGLHEADSPLDQSARDQDLPGLGALPVHSADRLGFPTDVERLRCFQLHARAQLKGLDAGLDLRVLVALLAVTFIEFPQEFELPALVRVGNTRVGGILKQSFDVRMPGVDIGSLVSARQKPRPPVLGAAVARVSAGTHGDKPGEVLVLTAQTIGHPGPETGPDQPRVSAVHQQDRRYMVGHVGLHGTDHRDVVDALPDVGKNLTDFDPALTVALELEGRPHHGTGSAFGDQVHAPGEFLAVVFVEGRFVVEGIDVGRTAAQEQVNHAFGLGGKVWLPRRQRGVEVAGRARCVPERIPHDA